MEQQLGRSDGLFGRICLLFDAVHRLVPALQRLCALAQQQEGGERLGRRTCQGVERLAGGVGADAGLVPEQTRDCGRSVQLARRCVQPDEFDAGLDARDRGRGKFALPATAKPGDEPLLLHRQAKRRFVGRLDLKRLWAIQAKLQFQRAAECLAPAEHEELRPGFGQQRKAAGPVGLRHGHLRAGDVGRVESHRLLERDNGASIRHCSGDPCSLKLSLPAGRPSVGRAEVVEPRAPVRRKTAQQVGCRQVVERSIIARFRCSLAHQTCCFHRIVGRVGRAEPIDKGRMFGSERLTKSLSDACVRHMRHLVV